MSGDALCVGVCMMDWDAGVCLGCGRTAEEIHKTQPPQAAEAEATPLSGVADMPGENVD